MKTVDYDPSFGEVEYPEGFLEKLQGKSIEEQMQYFRITSSSSFGRSSYGEVTDERINEYTYSLTKHDHCKGLIIKDGLIAGVLICSYSMKREIPCLPYHRVCTYYATDNNGAGYITRENHVSLICI